MYVDLDLTQELARRRRPSRISRLRVRLQSNGTTGADGFSLLEYDHGNHSRSMAAVAFAERTIAN